MPFLSKILKLFNNNVENKIFSILGLSFKPNTDDVRDSTSMIIAENLYNIYEFCKDGIMKGFTKRDSKLVYDAIPPIDEILDGWKQIK